MSTVAPAGHLDSFSAFATEGIPELVGTLLKAQRLAAANNWIVVRDQTAIVIDKTLQRLNRIATEFAEIADEAIIRKINDTQASNRPAQHIMESHIKSLPAPLGGVRVALLGELDLIRNPRGWGTFWQAQEYGTGQQGYYGEVPEQTGRVIFGVFEPSGTAPDIGQRGEGAGHDAAFVTDFNDPEAGLGTLSVELRGRHFLELGSAEAGAKYVAAMDGLQAQIIAEIEALMEEVAKQIRRVRNITAIIDM